MIPQHMQERRAVRCVVMSADGTLKLVDCTHSHTIHTASFASAIIHCDPRISIDEARRLFTDRNAQLG